VSVEHISTYLMIVNPLTIGLPSKLFVGRVKNICIMSTSECQMLNINVINIYVSLSTL